MSLWLMLLLSIGPYLVSWRLWFRDRIVKYRLQDPQYRPKVSSNPEPHYSRADKGSIHWEDFWMAVGAATLWSFFWPLVLPVVIVCATAETIERFQIETVVAILGGSSRKERKAAKLNKVN